MQELTQMLIKAETSHGALWWLNMLLKWNLPFNKPHRFTVSHVSSHGLEVKVPFRRANLNHLRGMHACAIATVGEFAAGLMLMRHFSSKNYRLILSELNVLYHKQGKTALTARAGLAQSEIDSLMTTLQEEGVSVKKMLAQVRDAKGEAIATVRTTWQLKRWEEVKLSV